MTLRRVQRHEQTPVCNLTVQELHTLAVGEIQFLVNNASSTGGMPRIGKEVGRGAEVVVYENVTEAESELMMARELISLAQQQGVDLASLYNSGTFFHDGTIIWFWRKNNTIHYSLQGLLGVLPQRYEESASIFHGKWYEAGTVVNFEEAFEFLKAWLIERKEVDDLPQRNVRREGIG